MKRLLTIALAFFFIGAAVTIAPALATPPTTQGATVATTPVCWEQAQWTVTWNVQHTPAEGWRMCSPDGRWSALYGADGNFVVYDATNRPYWQTGTRSDVLRFWPRGDVTLTMGGRLVYVLAAAPMAETQAYRLAWDGSSIKAQYARIGGCGEQWVTYALVAQWGRPL